MPSVNEIRDEFIRDTQRVEIPRDVAEAIIDLCRHLKDRTTPIGLLPELQNLARSIYDRLKGHV